MPSTDDMMEQITALAVQVARLEVMMGAQGHTLDEVRGDVKSLAKTQATHLGQSTGGRDMRATVISIVSILIAISVAVLKFSSCA